MHWSLGQRSRSQGYQVHPAWILMSIRLPMFSSQLLFSSSVARAETAKFDEGRCVCGIKFSTVECSLQSIFPRIAAQRRQWDDGTQQGTLVIHWLLISIQHALESFTQPFNGRSRRAQSTVMAVDSIPVIVLIYYAKSAHRATWKRIKHTRIHLTT